ncbi:hypothetical protein BDV59DRAFT_169799 [Aspergillus ambiguus]|uniref:uncharacterized protein n=1 Tax=Aspergillus ambiguus TaxID=176160 RepID=UPI003CCCE3F0
MSSVLNHVPSRSRVSLRAAHLLSSRSWLQEHQGDSPIRPINLPLCSNPPHNAFRPLRSRPVSTVSGPVSAQSTFHNDQPHGSLRDDAISFSENHCEPGRRSGLNHSPVPSRATPDYSNEMACTSPRYSPHPSERETSEAIPLPSSENAKFRRKLCKRLRGQFTTEVHNPRRASKRLPGTFSPTPTEYLIDTLQNVLRRPDDTENRNWLHTARNTSDHLMSPLTRKQRIAFKIHHRMSLQRIVADYIYLVDRILERSRREGSSLRAESDLNLALRKVFVTREHRKYLRARHYKVADVVAWSWILRSETPYKAILRILILEAEKTKNRKHSTHLVIPPFIPLLLLRQSLDSKAFRLLLIYSLNLMSGQRNPSLAQTIHEDSDDAVFEGVRLSGKPKPLLDPNTCATLAIRLLYHARQLWPEAQLPIARAYSFYLSTLESDGSGVALSNPQVMARTSNILLRLLSLPCKSGPFTSAPIQQEAQFELLKAMARSRPVLPVTRQGYQGIIAVQLAHRKTFDERQFAELKAPSWPPWKEDKLGIDSQRGIDGMKSRAMRVMSQMKEAGYAHSRWEEVSSILAGWDTDRSPTIQTRTLSRHPGLLRGRTGNHSHHTIWEARIRATRTVREAWACFLAYQDQGLPPRGAIYAAMAEKLVYRHKATKCNFDNGSPALPGDGPEVFPEPSSARDLIYVPTEPPTLDELLGKMLSEGIRPGGRFLALLIRSAPTLDAGLHYLSCSDLPNEQANALCSPWTGSAVSSASDQSALDEIPDYFFSSFISFLCRFSDSNEAVMRYGGNTAEAFPIAMNSHLEETQPGALGLGRNEHPNTLVHAVQLLKARRSRSPQPWVHLLFALKRVRITTQPRRLAPSTQLVLAWYEIMEVTSWMKLRGIDLGLQGFQALCKGFSRAVVAGVKDADASEEGLGLVSQAKQRGDLSHVDLHGLRVEDMVNGGLSTLKQEFDQLVFPDSKTSSLSAHTLSSIQSKTDGQVSLPPLYRIPSPAVLHAFVRSLGLAEDYDGLLSLLRWMSQYAGSLKEASDERMNGERIMRRTLVAVRAFLEGCWSQPASQRSEVRYLSTTPGETSDETAFTDPNLQEAYDIITATGVWGPWPSDEEVQEYLAVHWG